MSWRIIDRPYIKAQFQFEPHDLLIGLFWQRTETALHIFLSFIPMIRFHIKIVRLPAA